ncbi:MAG: phenylalanine--tRNA ligase subunit beta [Methylophaga sp.]|uniref:phenylalanine--tRNA ligase subunit beta n=1 Tax=Methylophaga sp. UBA678 TaxID=1946901 RepID=UPI000C63AD99|nr:phenylalanine--tRNA ligase subunit beta [Methylophaga sp. UBA678]MAX51188.1 phenylalanine--tRNA ligase subunit beta [Methylophaga sp.]|tara:strand:+ start:1996 stop:4371 length:2376 start_codon:yes stop_codon:yes gene_type:complete
MKFSEKWLREWVNPALDTDALVEKLTGAGLEVDAVEAVAGEFSGVVVGQVTSVTPHPDADKLRLTKVNVGGEALLDIVCGASNVREGLKIPVAVIGAVLPGNFKIKQAKLRGVPSFGMLCSSKELGLTESADGLMELADDAPVGEDFRVYLDLDDKAIDIDLTPNRSDCLSVAGVAREVGVLTSEDINAVASEPVSATSSKILDVNVEATAACPRYLGRIIENINPAAETPVWMQEKLRRSGLRSLGPVVDVTNYVMLELGQPMHAFDLGKIEQSINVRLSQQGEKLTLLDGQTIDTQADTLLICDAEKPLALAGVMGGQDSSVSSLTTSLFLESAFFAPEAIAGKARSYGLHTDSSHRFERGVDPELASKTMNRATSLLLEIVGGEAGPVIEECSEKDLPKTATIHLRTDRIKRVLGLELDGKTVAEQLTRLGLAVDVVEDGWQVSVPSFRFDLSIEVDLIEELGRLYGYDKLPNTRPQGTVLTTNITETLTPVERLQNLMVDRGYHEAVTYSFVEPKIQQLLAQDDSAPIKLANPISSDLSVMRTSLWPGLVQAMVYNANRQHDRIRLFEVGRVFKGTLNDIAQPRQIGGLIYGSNYAEQWSQKPREVDFFDIKADVEALLALGGGQVRFEKESHPALHPGQSARVYKNDEAIGWLGAIHPKLNKSLDIDGKVYVFELSLNELVDSVVPEFETLSKFPALRRDLALLVDDAVNAGQIEDCLSKIDSDILKSFQLFDVYSGEGVELGKKSLAVAFILQHKERTLTDDEVDSLLKTVTETLSQKLNATIRS